MENIGKQFSFWESDPDIQLLMFRPSDGMSPHLQKRENISPSPSTYVPFICLLCLCSTLRWEAVPYMHNTYTGSTYTVHACSLWVLLWKNSPHILLADILSITLSQLDGASDSGERFPQSSEHRITCRLQTLYRTGAAVSENFCSPTYSWSPQLIL